MTMFEKQTGDNHVDRDHVLMVVVVLVWVVAAAVVVASFICMTVYMYIHMHTNYTHYSHYIHTYTYISI